MAEPARAPTVAEKAASPPEIRRYRELQAKGEAAQTRYAVLAGLRALDASRLARQVEAGLPFSSFAHVQASLGVPAAELGKIVDIPPRTLARRRQKGQLDAPESDRLLRASRLLGHALELFDGDEEAAREWLRKPQHGLGGAVPLELARTEVGAREVERLIGRLEHGVFS